MMTFAIQRLNEGVRASLAAHFFALPMRDRIPGFLEIQVQQLDRIDMTDSGTLEPLTDLVISPIDTHWSRILYYDLFSGRTGDSTSDPRERAERYMPATYGFMTVPSRGKNREIFVAAKSSSRDTGSDRIGSRIKATAVLLGIYIAMYLAVWVILRALTFSDATAAIAPDASIAPIATATLRLPRLT